MQTRRNDETLVLLTLAGDQSAYEELVRKYEKAVVASAQSVTRNRYLAEDAAQDAFITGWMKLDSLKSPEKYGAWVCRIAKNCARNMAMRFEDFLDLEVVENVRREENERDDPAELYLQSEEKSELLSSISRLSKKVQTVIKLHYFEGLSIAEIAEKMQITQGTVKWQLHEGRKKLRKDLCAMNETMNDELVVRVMKKVAELKAFERMNSKEGFEKVYKDVLKEVEELPECREKQSALADVLMYGWWWVPGEKNDKLLARIKKAAEEGKNEEVMIFVCSKEDGKWWGSSGIEFILEKQIPYLQELGFKTAEGAEWLEVANRYFRAEDRGYAERDGEKGREALEKALKLLPENHRLHTFARCVGYCEEYFEKELSEKHARSYRVLYDAFLMETGEKGLCLMEKGGLGMGELCALDWQACDLLRSASMMDGCFTLSDLQVGERKTGSDGTVLIYCSDSETVKTPAGIFEGCQKWHIDGGDHTTECWYKAGVGLVKYSYNRSGWQSEQLLSSYKFLGGSGLLPLAKGNFWKYTAGCKEEYLLCDVAVFVASVSGNQATLGQISRNLRFGYDQTSWLDAILEMRNEYCKDHELVDVTPVMARARKLASTPLERAHTEAACSVMERILCTDEHINPNYTATGHWNFFQWHTIHQAGGEIRCARDNTLFNFEWKRYDGRQALPVINSDIYGILNDTVGCLWSEKWVDGFKETGSLMRYGERFSVEITAKKEEQVQVPAGTFDNCLKVSTDMHLSDSNDVSGLTYRGGKRDYYFAPGVGLVKAVSHYVGGETCDSDYELVSFEKTGEGYMPIVDGMKRVFEAKDLSDGYEAGATYTCVIDENGTPVLFEDRKGIKKKLGAISSYSSIIGEVKEKACWNRGPEGHDECRRHRAENNLNLTLHFLQRMNPYRAPDGVEWYKFRIRMLEFLAEGGEMPTAWLGLYADYHFLCACATFGCRKEELKDEAYAYLERAFELYPRWYDIPAGTLLELGNKTVFGGIRIVKGEGEIQFPDGSRAPMYGDSAWDFENDPGRMANGMTNLSGGWCWFDSAREDERFKDYIKRAVALAEKYNNI